MTGRLRLPCRASSKPVMLRSTSRAVARRSLAQNLVTSYAALNSRQVHQPLFLEEAPAAGAALWPGGRARRRAGRPAVDENGLQECKPGRGKRGGYAGHVYCSPAQRRAYRPAALSPRPKRRGIFPQILPLHEFIPYHDPYAGRLRSAAGPHRTRADHV